MGMLALFGPLGLPEMLIILAIVILIFGANRLPELGKTLGEELLTPTRIYARAIAAALGAYKRKQAVLGIANITGASM